MATRRERMTPAKQVPNLPFVVLNANMHAIVIFFSFVIDVSFSPETFDFGVLTVAAED
jgi:hypothetical protein